jgi:hypothetical protein
MTRFGASFGLAAFLALTTVVHAQDTPDSPKLVLYTQPSLGGDSRSILASFSNLEAIDFDNKARSVRVLAGTWEVCEEKHFKKCREVVANVPDLDTIGLARKISSVRLLHTSVGSVLHAARTEAISTPPAAPATSPAGPTPRIVFFDKTDFRGGSLKLDAPRGNLAALTARAESVRVGAGTWQLCTGMNYTGTCTTVAADRDDLGTWKNRIVSARPVTPAGTPVGQ